MDLILGTGERKGSGAEGVKSGELEFKVSSTTGSKPAWATLNPTLNINK